MRLPLAALTLIAAAALPLHASAEETEGRRLAELAFSSLDGGNRGFIDYGEFHSFSDEVFASMDNDQSAQISLSEFLAWDYGMRLAAEDAGREAAYETALRVVFAFWDRNGDGQVSKREHRQSLVFDFQRADSDNDAVLSREEFLSGFSVMVALRAAINPPAAE